MNAATAAKLDIEDTLALERAIAIEEARDAAVSDLLQHGLRQAARALRKSGSFRDFFAMRGALLAGGVHCVRLRGGRGIER